MFYILCGGLALANWGWMEGYESKSYDRIGVRDGWMDDCCRANFQWFGLFYGSVQNPRYPFLIFWDVQEYCAPILNRQFKLIPYNVRTIPANSPSGINVPDLTMAGCSKNDGRSIQPPFYSVRVHFHGQQGLIPRETCMLYLQVVIS